MTMDSLAKIREALPGFSYADYLRHMKTVEAASHGATPLRIAILRTCLSKTTKYRRAYLFLA